MSKSKKKPAVGEIKKLIAATWELESILNDDGAGITMNTGGKLDAIIMALTLIAKKLAAAKVVIEVMGGVADCTECPDFVEVEIIDHDNEAHQ